MHVFFAAIVVAMVVVGDAFEEKQSAFPPALVLGLVGLFGVVFGDGFLELEVYGVYGSCCLTFVSSCFFQDLDVFDKKRKGSESDKNFDAE